MGFGFGDTIRNSTMPTRRGERRRAQVEGHRAVRPGGVTAATRCPSLSDATRRGASWHVELRMVSPNPESTTSSRWHGRVAYAYGLGRRSSGASSILPNEDSLRRAFMPYILVHANPQLALLCELQRYAESECGRGEQ
jgi:hypothetical protein